MPDYLIRVTHSQLLRDSAVITASGATAGQAAALVLRAAHGEDHHRLPDGRILRLDPEDLVGNEIHAEIIENDRMVGTFGRPMQISLEHDEAAALRAILNDAIIDTGSNVRATLCRAMLVKLSGSTGGADDLPSQSTA